MAHTTTIDLETGSTNGNGNGVGRHAAAVARDHEHAQAHEHAADHGHKHAQAHQHTAAHEHAPAPEHGGPAAGRKVDRPAAERAAADLLTALGADLGHEGLAETPRRMVDAYIELMTPRPFRATTFANEDNYDELVLVRAIPFHSLCMHHLLPFYGVAHVGYLPGERIVGISKLARVVELFARDLQVQERLTTQIAGWVAEELRPKGVGVVIEAEHMCMSLRGVQKPGAVTVTSALRGQIRDDPRTRQEFLALTERSRD